MKFSPPTDTPPPKNFCASPWVEAVLKTSGELHSCCRTMYSYGNWKTDPLKETWNSPKAQAMRRAIREGRFPDDCCRTCWKNKKAGGLQKLLSLSFSRNINTIRKQLDVPPDTLSTRMHQTAATKLPFLSKVKCSFSFRKGETHEPSQLVQNLQSIQKVFFKRLIDAESRQILDRATQALNLLQLDNSDNQETYYIALNKMRVIKEIAEDFLTGNLTPRHTAPFRQPNIILICNARCIHCIGRFTGDIIHGKTFNDIHYTHMPQDEIERALEERDSLIDFFAGNTEFLFFKHWERLASELKKTGIKIRLSSNGILLTESNTKKLIDNGYLASLNVSTDGASPETIEKIRAGVKHDRLMQNLKFFFDYAAKHEYWINITFSFCLMKSNYHELPDMVDFAHGLAGKNKGFRVGVVVQSLSQYGPDLYKQFLNDEHPSTIDRNVLVQKFEQTLDRSSSTGIPVYVFDATPIEKFVAQGCPIPKLKPVELSLTKK